MKKVRFFVHLLLNSLFLVNVSLVSNGNSQVSNEIVEKKTIASKESQDSMDMQSKYEDHATSPIEKKSKDNKVVDHGVTPVDTTVSLPKFPSYPDFSSCPDCQKSFQSLVDMQRENSHRFASSDDLSALGSANHSPNSPKKAALVSHIINCHGTTPVTPKKSFMNSVIEY